MSSGLPRSISLRSPARFCTAIKLRRGQVSRLSTIMFLYRNTIVEPTDTWFRAMTLPRVAKLARLYFETRDHSRALAHQLSRCQPLQHHAN